MAKLVLTRALEGTNLSADVRAQVLAAVEEKKTGAVKRGLYIFSYFFKICFCGNIHGQIRFADPDLLWIIRT